MDLSTKVHSPDGVEMSDEHWNVGYAKSLGIYLNGLGIHWTDPKGQRITDDSFYVIFNAHHEPLDFVLPDSKYGKHWTKMIDTNVEDVEDKQSYSAGDSFKVEGRSIVVLHHPIKIAEKN